VSSKCWELIWAWACCWFRWCAQNIKTKHVMLIVWFCGLLLFRSRLAVLHRARMTQIEVKTLNKLKSQSCDFVSVSACSSLCRVFSARCSHIWLGERDTVILFLRRLQFNRLHHKLSATHIPNQSAQKRVSQNPRSESELGRNFPEPQISRAK
jgi:hypothetical protein